MITYLLRQITAATDNYVVGNVCVSVGSASYVMCPLMTTYVFQSSGQSVTEYLRFAYLRRPATDNYVVGNVMAVTTYCLKST